MATKFKNIIITGASSGIGEALTEYYAQNGAENIFICGRNAERLEKVAEVSRKHKCNIYSKEGKSQMSKRNQKKKRKSVSKIIVASFMALFVCVICVNFYSQAKTI